MSSANNNSFDISQLPSLKDGMTQKEEAIKRRKTCRFIEEAGRVLKLPRVAISTALVFFHRFYAKHSFQTHDRFEVAVACILLAAKTEEAPRKLVQVIDECHKVKARGMQQGRISTAPGGSPQGLNKPTELDPQSEEFEKLKERVLLLERVTLHTIGFELSVDHPYKFLVEDIQRLVHQRKLEYIDQSDNKASTSQTKTNMTNQLVQYAMNFANDSMQTSLCLQFEPHKIATATIYLSGHFVGVRPTGGKPWLDVLGQPDVYDLGSICAQIMELITERKGPNVDKTYTKIKEELEASKASVRDAKRQRTS